MAGWLYLVRVEPPRREVEDADLYVDSIVVHREDVIDHFVGYGTVEADRMARLSAEIPSRVIERVKGIESGSVVKSGQGLIRLDNREYQHALERAEALSEVEEASLAELKVEAEKLDQMVKTAQRELDVAISEKNRVSDLYERKLAAQKEFNVAITAYQRSRLAMQNYERERARLTPRMAKLQASKRGFEAAVKMAQLNVERCEIRAPFSGTIQTLWVDVGDRVAPGVLILTMIDSSIVEIPIQLPGAVYDQTKITASCRIECESTPNRFWSGEISRIGPDVDPLTRTFSAYVRVDNRSQSNHLIPGSFVRAVVTGPLYKDRVLIPRGAIRNGTIFVSNSHVAHEKRITVERFILDRAMVTGDLHEGDVVILSHLDAITDGDTVHTTPSETREPTRINKKQSP